MEDALNSHAIKIMYNACRDEMADMPYLDEVDTMQKQRLCYHRFYILFNKNYTANFMPTKDPINFEKKPSK